MREQTFHSVEHRILEAFPAGRAYSRDEVAEAVIPAGIKHFLLSALHRRSELEASELLNVRSDWFDSEHEEYRKVVQQAVLTLGKSALFPASEWPKAVHQAVEHVLEYLVSPVSLLVRFVFPSDSDSISASDLLRKAGYFVDYPYLVRGVEAYVSRKNNQRIFKSEFGNALSHLDRQMTAAYTPEEWLKLLNPLIDILGHPTPGLPVVFAIQFFHAKGQEAFAEMIQRAAASKRADLVSATSLKGLLEQSLLEQSLTEQSIRDQELAERARKEDAERQKQSEAPRESPRPVSSADASPPEPGAREVASPAPEQAQGTEPTAPLPLWKKFQKNDPEAGESQPAPSPEPLWKKFNRQKEEASVMENVTLQQPATRAGGAPDLTLTVLGSEASGKNAFIHHLFRGDERAFEDAIRALASAPDWTTASEIIAQRVFRPFKVDIYSDSAIHFTNAVESRYSGMRS